MDIGYNTIQNIIHIYQNKIDFIQLWSSWLKNCSEKYTFIYILFIYS